MRTKWSIAAVLSVLATASSAQSTAPLSAIDWLSKQNTPAPQTVAQPRQTPTKEAPVTLDGSAPKVTVAALDAQDERVIGLLPAHVTGLPKDLWAKSDLDALTMALSDIGLPKLPATQAFLFTLLLSEAKDLTASEAAVAWNEARIRKLLQLGAVEPAAALAKQANSVRNPTLFSAWLDAALLSETEAEPCSQVLLHPELSSERAVQIYCTAHSDDFETAALIFGTSAALGMLDPTKEALLARFLDPDLFEDLPTPPLRPDPLEFRLYEAAGSPLPTTPLPRAFAYANLREQSGWKSQLEAAERLTRAGALSTNRLLGFYTSRKPAASGGVWDRVSAWQRFDAALQAQNVDAIALSLPPFWRSMKSAGLEIAAADLFAKKVSRFDLPKPAADIAFRMQLLSSEYEAARPSSPSSRHDFMMSVAQGKPDAALADTENATAIAAAFASPVATTDAPLGLSILASLAKLEIGAAGDTGTLTGALKDLRALGLEDVARRAALQILILKDSAS